MARPKAPTATECTEHSLLANTLLESQHGRENCQFDKQQSGQSNTMIVLKRCFAWRHLSLVRRLPCHIFFALVIHRQPFRLWYSHSIPASHTTSIHSGLIAFENVLCSEHCLVQSQILCLLLCHIESPHRKTATHISVTLLQLDRSFHVFASQNSHSIASDD